MRLLAAAALGLILASCRASTTVEQGIRAPMVEVADLDERALLLLLADRRVYEPYAVDTVLRDKGGLRVELATTLGRVGDLRARPLLEEMLVEADSEVRRAAAFALGRLGSFDAIPALLRAVRDPDDQVGSLAVRSLARLGVALDRVVAAGDELSERKRARRLLPHLFRFSSPLALSLAKRGLEEEDAFLRARSAYALAREPQPGWAPLLRTLLGDSDPWVRSLAARALGAVGGRTDLEGLLPLLADREAAPVIAALRGAHQLVARGISAPPESWEPSLLDLLDDPRPGVVLTALEAAQAWLLHDELGEALIRRVESGSPPEREAALLALASAGDPRGMDYAVSWASSGVEERRRLAAGAAAILPRYDLLETLSRDADATVRLTAVAGLLTAPGDRSAEAARAALADPDAAVRAVALQWLSAEPVAPVEELGRAVADREGRVVVELRLAGVAALVARGVAEPLERGAVVRWLEELAERASYPVRRAAAAGLARLEQTPPALGSAEKSRDISTYRDLVRRTARARFAELSTRHGTLSLRLDCPAAPLTCFSFLQLANGGFYDGLVFHRVVPGVVVQGGDPRGDGWGGPGFTLRDEVNPRLVVRGSLGMALSGPDTAGSQFFIALGPQPQLEDDFTIFGQVIAGLETLDLIVEGDLIERLTEVVAPGEATGVGDRRAGLR